MPVGTPIYAAGSGVVNGAVVDGRSCNPDTYPGGIQGCIDAGIFGTRLKINHPDGTTSQYLHLSSIAPGIGNGSAVVAGQHIGFSGQTGIATGPHLHYAEFSGATDLDPGVWVACHGSAIVSYDGLQNRKGQTIRNDGYNCAAGSVAQPANFRVISTSESTISLAWDPVPSATQYRLLRDGVEISLTSATSFVDYVEPDAGYIYAVSSISAGTGESSSVSMVAISDSATPELTDFDGDGRADFCRRVGGTGPESRVACTVSTGVGFGETFISAPVDWGYDTNRAWVDFDGDGRADFCRRVGGTGPESRVACTVSTGVGFGETFISAPVDWGYDTNRAWVGPTGSSVNLVGTGTLTGTVVTGSGGVRGAAIRIYMIDGKSPVRAAVSDVSGSWSVSVNAGTYRVQVVPPSGVHHRMWVGGSTGEDSAVFNIPPNASRDVGEAELQVRS
jgi:hypothetical protein